MTAQEWIECNDPERLLLALRMDGKEGVPLPAYLRIGTEVIGDRGELMHFRVSERKLRLFAVACCRRVWHLLTDERSRRVVEVSEKFAEGQSSAEELRTARHEACIPFGSGNEVGAARDCADSNALAAALQADNYTFDPQRALEGQRQKMNLLRCICGNPFRPVTLQPNLLTPAAVRLASAIYNDRAFSLLPILGDALEEAGCTEEDVLRHCRGGEGHVRGCWIVDLVLGKS